MSLQESTNGSANALEEEQMARSVALNNPWPYSLPNFVAVPFNLTVSLFCFIFFCMFVFYFLLFFLGTAFLEQARIRMTKETRPTRGHLSEGD